jgi:hypothetical protein
VLSKWLKRLAHTRLQIAHTLLEYIHVGEVELEEKTVMLGDATPKCFDQHLAARFETPAAQCDKLLWIGLPATSASRIARPLLPSTSLIALAILMLVSSSTFSIRLVCWMNPRKLTSADVVLLERALAKTSQKIGTPRIVPLDRITRFAVGAPRPVRSADMSGLNRTPVTQRSQRN